MIWPLTRTAATDGASLTHVPPPPRHRVTAPRVARWSVLYDCGAHIGDLNVIFCTRRYWERRRQDTEGWTVLDVGPFLVIAVRLQF